ncbi:hypothetical protein GGQ86_000831 [Xanthobacter flavus]|uniref:Uncharacterized protein n=1 Tax=Xanthobacter flavus TaxID=281 RepID=A0A9W6CK47_XANFL|nr:hypothetical protein [Xanthobacter flavus]MDR6332384.1 hypothetical protein [Xanthobacter flavus]GLI21865.1 hypothetical protein XFLAVUS301_15390 [Xanthobacter flavus]
MTTQTEIEHTPGPWSFSKCTCGHPACHQFVLSNQGSVGFVEEDARLMCASPEMLEELKLQAIAIRQEIERINPRECVRLVSLQARLTRIEAVIARAMGR